MSILEIFLTGVGLSMDAFAVSVCKGLSLRKAAWKKAILAGLWFGGFQALMPALGYLAGSRFYSYIEKFDHWVVFILLSFIGISMIREVVKDILVRRKTAAASKTGGKERESAAGGDSKTNDDFSMLVMLSLAVATSIDALAVGISLSLLRVNIAGAAVLIGCTTFVLSAAGVRLGSRVGEHFHEKAQAAGGVILILIGTHILLQHLGIMPF